MKLFVTGASGYLGGALVRSLLPYHQLRLLVRRPESIGDLQGARGIEVVEGDLLVKASWEEKLSGCDGVLHLAALVKQWAPPQHFFAVNRDAFRHLLECCWKKKIGVFIYTSSFIALGPSDNSTDDSLWRVNAYARSKREALTVARDYQKKGFPLTTLIPTVLYGPGTRTEGNHLTPFLESLIRGRPQPLADGGKWIWNFAFIDDITAGFRLALEKGKGRGEYVLGGVSVSVEQFFLTAARLLGQDWHPPSLPLWAMKGYAFFEELRASVSRPSPRLTRGALAVYRHDWDFQDTKAREELGYKTVPLEEGLKRTLDWLKKP